VLSLRRADHSSRGVLPAVVRRCVWYRNLITEDALAHWGLLHQNKQTIMKTDVPLAHWFAFYYWSLRVGARDFVLNLRHYQCNVTFSVCSRMSDEWW
jgi:hypothetical protein